MTTIDLAAEAETNLKRQLQQQADAKAEAARAAEAAIPPREKLARAIAWRAEAKVKAASARKALASATALVATREAALKEYEGLGREIAQRHAQLIVDAATKGQSLEELGFSSELRVRKTAMQKAQDDLDDANEQLEAAKMAHGVLGDGVTEAERNLAMAEYSVTEAAELVINSEVEEMAAMLIRLRKEIWRMDDMLYVLSQTTFSQNNGAKYIYNVADRFKIGPVTREAIANSIRPQSSALAEQNRYMEAAQYWRKFYDGLLASADAECEPTE